MDPEVLAISIIVLLFSVVLHEVMHGYVAKLFGDHTAENAGRLTLNPLPHIDLIGTILLPLMQLIFTGRVFFGWAKPVPVNPLHFSDIRRGELLVSLAGVGSNFGLALIGALLFHINNLTLSSPLVSEIAFFTIRINVALGIINLIPIPPLDGSKALMSQLPYNLARDYAKLEMYGMIILLVLFTTNALNIVYNLIISPLTLLLTGGF